MLATDFASLVRRLGFPDIYSVELLESGRARKGVRGERGLFGAGLASCLAVERIWERL